MECGAEKILKLERPWEQGKEPGIRGQRPKGEVTESCQVDRTAQTHPAHRRPLNATTATIPNMKSRSGF